MVSGMKLDPDTAKSSYEMRHVIEQGRISMREQTLGAVRENISFTFSEETFRNQQKNMSGHSLGKPYVAPNHELRQAADTGQMAQPKSSESDQKPRIGHKCCDGDELVKHMSNLPGFLQQVDKGKSIQEKALNFGVLDWKRLEKWKYTERMPRRSPKETSSASQPPKIGPSLKKKLYPHGCDSSALYSGKQSLPHSSEFNSPLPHSSSLKEEKYVGSIGSKGNETCAQKLQAAQISAVCRQQDHFRQRVQLCQRSCSKTNVDYSKSMNLRKEMLLPEKKKHRSGSLPATDALGKRGGMSSSDALKQTVECYLVEPQNSVFLPKHSPKNGYSESSQLLKSWAAHDGHAPQVVGNTLSDFFSADALHSFPRPSAATVHAEHAMEPYLQNQSTSHAADLDIRMSASGTANSATSATSEGKCSMIPEETTRPSAVIKASNRITEQPVVRGRAPSPTRLFSFSLRKLSRSGSFKDSSTVPQLQTNVKLCQVKPDNLERDKETANSRAQSSPLRRLLNPLLKYKGAQSAELDRPSNGRLHTMTVRSPGTKGPSQDRKQDTSCVQALLQLTLKNELPFFKLVVDNSEDMLAAAVNRLPTSGKNNPCMIYTFYSVHEIRKKGMNWISQGPKSKNCSLGYKVVGQMNISNSYHLNVKAGDYDASHTRECVLYGADPGEVDNHTLGFVPNKEIAAIIVKTSVKKPKAEWSGTSHLHNGMVVILPGGVHSIPVKGAPSSLISRWRSGGQCDCGGWDVGCQLQILADHRKCSSIPQASVSSADVDRVNLYMQGDELKTKPLFSLEPLSNGLYSVELDASISLLEAFATCVAYVTCLKFPEIVGNNGSPDVEHFQEAVVGTDTNQLPGKYVACPPWSPAGRI